MNNSAKMIVNQNEVNMHAGSKNQYLAKLKSALVT